MPLSTYRLQVHGGFPLATARDVVAVSRLPRRRARATRRRISRRDRAAPTATTSADHNEINAEARRRCRRTPELHAALASHGLQHIVDFVPNHMGIGTGRNAWWNDVLENGPSSPAAAFFDIDWAPEREALHAKLLLPDPRRSVRPRARARRAAARVPRRPAGPEVRRRPAADQPAAVAARLPSRPRAAHGGARRRHPALQEFQSIITVAPEPAALHRTAPGAHGPAPAREGRRARPARAAGRGGASGRRADRAAVAAFNGAPGRPAASTRCTSCSSRSPTGSRTGARLRTRSTTAASSTSTRWPASASSSPEVFAATHALLATLLRDGNVDGVRDRPSRTACSIRRGTSRCCRSSPPALEHRAAAPTAAARPGRCTSSPRRSCRAASAAVRDGRSTARPATTI